MDVVKGIFGTVHAGNLASVGIEAVFHFFHPGIETAQLFRVFEDDGSGSTDDLAVMNDRDSVGDNVIAIDLLELEQFFFSGLGDDVQAGIFQNLCNRKSKDIALF